ncbi:MAG TPA: alkaline phosphatase [Synechococcales cyanobacterium M55_K2018_004]|nr:alkaline phosphatase [Synechococcales cyanobacterium M55_K2018_004]
MTTTTGNHVIFIHPDGTSPATFAFARFVDRGPDGRLNYDKMAEARVYLGHMEDQLTGTSNGGAVTHATGVKVYSESFGFEVVRDANGKPVVGADGRLVETDLVAASGKKQTIMQEAVAANKATALINSGVIAEPGTGAFVAKVGQRDVPDGAAGFARFPRAQFAEITRQVVESGVDVILGGGLVNYLPVGTTPPPEAAAFATSAAQLDAISTDPSQRPSINLIERAKHLGYTVVYTEEQLHAAVANPNVLKVLGIFANEDTFNDNVRTATGNLTGVEENLIATGTPNFVPSAPTVGEMLKAAQIILERNPKFQNGSFMVVEEEGTDNFGNINNAAGMLEATLRADEAIGAALKFVEKYPNTLVIKASDSEAGGLQVREPLAAGNVGTINANPTNVTGQPGPFPNPMDGQTGRGTQTFTSAPAANGLVSNFGIGWVGTPDFAGNIVVKAHGLNASRLPVTIDNTDIYKAMYETLFGVTLTPRVADQPKPPAATKTSGNVIFIHPDGHSPALFAAARFTSQGPDGRLNWDNMTNTGVYLGHLTDQLTGSSDGSGVVHAMGVKVFQDSYGLNEDGSRVTSFSEKVGTTILEEARDRGKAVVLINSGRMSEPGSGAFAAEVDNRSNNNEIIRQIVMESGAQVIMGGGERWMLPTGVAGRFGGPLNQTGARTDGLNLIEEAQKLGYRVIYTKEELATIQAGEKILGVFGWEDTYNSITEELLASRGLKAYGQPGNLNPPDVGDMLEGALRAVKDAPNGFFIVLEEEGTDNFPNANNASGTIEAALRADKAIGIAQNFIRNVDPNTLLITAADSEAGGLQVWQPTPFAPGFPDTPLSTTPTLNANPTNVASANANNPLDGVNGRLAPWTGFRSQDSFDGAMGNFGIGWVGTPDFPGNTIAKTYGMNANLLPSTLDNTEIYKIMYKTLFGVLGDPTAIRGTAGNDVLRGTANGDTFIAGGGDDIIEAGEGDNRIYIGVGNSTITAGNGNDVVSTDDGNHTIRTNGGDDRISTGRGNSKIDAGKGNDIISVLGGNTVINAGEGRDVINAGNGNDTIRGEDGDDVILAGNGNNSVNGGNGNDRMIAGSGNDDLRGGAGDDFINAGEGANTLKGGDGNDTLLAGAGDDIIFGGLGDDTINAGTGTNTINAGSGNNVIISRGIDDITVSRDGMNRFDLIAGPGIATIRGFTADDRIRLGSGLTFDALTISRSGRDTLLTVTATGDLLAVLKGVQPSTITRETFA